MTPALALIAGALTGGWLLPAGLRRFDVRRRDPVLLIVAWLTSMAAVVLTAAAGVLLLFLPGHGPVGALLAAVHHCWSALRHGASPGTEELAGVFGVAVLLVLAARVGLRAWRSGRQRSRTRAAHLALLRPAARHEPGTPDLLWLPHDRPLAFSLTGKPGVVVATEGLTRHLSRSGVAAVLAHERAHLAGRHHLLLATADALRGGLPFVPLFREAPAALRELAELAADTSAISRHGAAAVHEALCAVTRHAAPPGALAMASDAVETRLARLEHGVRTPSRARRALSCCLAMLTATATPFLTAGALLTGLAVLSCSA
ncbi:M56 family metallopeptidase [Amycolatopsis albispora]|uniref:Peptidase n=1 Tax=Amycolatopsis albispora TaxID=1804986 RepID=A0A344L0M6_9PSEU|nr:M56 family metallopeptidase [Amycolatopsis albispora]AXB41600.1 peptidase [Amycolatopsis albispora]